MTRQEFGAILFIGLSLFSGVVILLIREINTDFLPDLARAGSPDASIVHPGLAQETEGHPDLLSSEPALSSEAVDNAGKQVKPGVSLSINAASSKDLQGLPGIGPELARRILAYRQQNGAFRSIAQLLDVKGIGPAKLERLKPYISFH